MRRTAFILILATLPAAAHGCEGKFEPAPAPTQCPAGGYRTPSVGWSRWQLENCTGRPFVVVHTDQAATGTVTIYRVGRNLTVDLIGDQVTGVHLSRPLDAPSDVTDC